MCDCDARAELNRALDSILRIPDVIAVAVTYFPHNGPETHYKQCDDDVRIMGDNLRSMGDDLREHRVLTAGG